MLVEDDTTAMKGLRIAKIVLDRFSIGNVVGGSDNDQDNGRNAVQPIGDIVFVAQPLEPIVGLAGNPTFGGPCPEPAE